jgi:hypothetical protein
VELNSTPCGSGSHTTEFPSPENHACALEQARSQDEMTECFRISVNRSTARRLGALGRFMAGVVRPIQRLRVDVWP